MSTEPQLTDALRRRLEESVTDVYTTMLESSSDPDSADFSGTVAEQLLDAFTEALSLNHRVRNRRFSLLDRLPDELWCHIWLFLPFAARVAISHTCHTWRSMALSFSELWTSITFYTTTHSSDCNCHDCGSDEDYQRDRTHPTGWNLSPYRSGSTNLPDAWDILERSGQLQLHLTLVIVPYCADEIEILELAMALDMYKSRIITLRIRSSDHSGASDFLKPFQDLTSLEEISAEDLGNDDGAVDQAVLLPPFLYLPALRSIQLDYGFKWRRAGDLYTSIRELCIDLHELSPALAACPHLDSLRVHLDIEKTRDDSSSNPTEAYIFPESLQSVSLITSCRQRSARALAILHDATRSRIAVNLRGYVGVSTAAPIFSDLAAESLHVRLVYDSGSLTIEGTDGRGRVRSVEYGSSASAAALLNDIRELPIDPHLVNRLTLSSCLLDHLTALWPSLPSVRELEIIVGNEDTEECDPNAPLAPTPQFPAVRAVTLVGDRCTSTVSEKDVTNLLRRLTLHLPLTTLTIDHRVFMGPHSALDAVACSVFVGVCHV